MYVIEDEPSEGQNHELEFQSMVPYHSNDWSAGYVINSVNSSLYGQGKTFFVVTKPLPATHNKRGLTMNIMGSIVFADNQN